MCKIFRLFFCCLILSGIDTELRAQWDSTSRPDIYKAQVELFKAMPLGKRDVVFYGNNITKNKNLLSVCTACK